MADAWRRRTAGMLEDWAEGMQWSYEDRTTGRKRHPTVVFRKHRRERTVGMEPRPPSSSSRRAHGAEERGLRCSRPPATVKASGGEGGCQEVVGDKVGPFWDLAELGGQWRGQEAEGSGPAFWRRGWSPAATGFNRLRPHRKGRKGLTMAAVALARELRGELATGGADWPAVSFDAGALQAMARPEQFTERVSE